MNNNDATLTNFKTKTILMFKMGYKELRWWITSAMVVREL